VAGKTGTTEDNTDGWFNGFTPQLATTVWMGDPNGRTHMTPPRTPIDVFGGTYPASIWHDYTEAALAGQPAIAFPTPDMSKVPGGKLISSAQLRADEPFEPAAPSTTITVPTTSTTLPTSTSTTQPGSHHTVPTTLPKVPKTTCITFNVHGTPTSVCYPG
jgi:penicillin-binding protein 1A